MINLTTEQLADYYYQNIIANYKEKQIEIAFRPRDGKFEVCDAAIRKDPEYIANISELWASQKSSWTLVNDFLKKAKEQGAKTKNGYDMLVFQAEKAWKIWNE